MTEVLPQVESKNFTPLPATKNRLILYASTKDSSVLKPVQPVTQEYVETLTPTMEYDINNQTFTLIENASNRERLDKAGVAKKDIPEAVKTWAEKNAKVVNKMKGVYAIDSLLGREPEQVGAQDMVNFYNVYFDGPNNESNIKTFVHDVVASYYFPDGMQGDRKLNVSRLRKDLPSIQRLAQAFGDTSGEIIAQLIDAEIDLINTPKDELSTKIGKDINAIKEDDTRLLKFLIEGQAINPPKIIPVKPKVTSPVSATVLTQLTSSSNEPFVLKVKTFPGSKNKPPPSAVSENVSTDSQEIDLGLDESTTVQDVFDLLKTKKNSVIGYHNLLDNKDQIGSGQLKHDIESRLSYNERLVSFYENRIIEIEDLIIPEIFGITFEEIKNTPELIDMTVNGHKNLLQQYRSLKTQIVAYTLFPDKINHFKLTEVLHDFKALFFQIDKSRLDRYENHLNTDPFIIKHKEALKKKISEIENRKVEQTQKSAPPDTITADYDAAFAKKTAQETRPPLSKPGKEPVGESDFMQTMAAAFETKNETSVPPNFLIAKNYREVIDLVKNSQENVIQISMDSRGLATLIPEMIKPLEEIIFKKTKLHIPLSLKDPPSDIPINNKKVKANIVVAAETKIKTFDFKIALELKNNLSGKDLDTPTLSINPRGIPFVLDFQNEADNFFKINSIGQSIKIGLQKEIGEMAELNDVEITLTDQNEVHLVIHTKAP